MGSTIDYSPSPLRRLIERIVVDAPPGLIAAIGMSPPQWPDGAVLVFDDGVSIVDAVAGVGPVPFDLDVLFVRRSELALLGYQPSVMVTPTHPDVWARQGDVLWGADLRGEIPAIGDPRTRLAINIERALHAMRRPILFCLTTKSDKMLIRLLGREIAELRRSVELVASSGAAPPNDVEDAFAAWRGAARGRSGARAAWHFERVLLRLRRWLSGGRLRHARERRPEARELAHRDVLQPRDAVDARYQAHLAGMLNDLTPIDDRIVSVLLFGSMVRHTLRPAISDVMDAIVVVEDRALASEAAYATLLSTFVRACRRLAASGVTFHPFEYVSRTEITEAAIPFYDGLWRSDARSLVVAGEDLRPALRPSAAGGVWGQRALFAMALRYRRVAALVRPDSRPPDRQFVLRAIQGGLKPLPILACLSCGQSVDVQDAPATLARTLDGIDLSRYREVLSVDERTLRDEDVPALVRTAIDVAETIASRTADWVRRHREASFWRV